MKKPLFILFLYATLAHAQTSNSLTIHFDFDKYTLRADAIKSLDSLLAAHPVSQIRISSHCDLRGNDSYNDKLAARRSESVKAYFIEHGVKKEEIVTASFGKRDPLSALSDENSQSLNRRSVIEYIISQKAVVDPRPVVRELVGSDIPEYVPAPKIISENDSTIDISSMKPGDSFKFENLNFEGGRHIFLPQAKPALALLLKTMKENPKLKIQIAGFVCCLEGDEDGMDWDTRTRDLSMRRAKAVYQFLRDNGIDDERLLFHGYGASPKLVEEHTEADRTMNRRVEIRVVEK